MSIAEQQQRLKESRERLCALGLGPEAIGVVHRHPGALEAVRAAVSGDELDAPTVPAGPRYGLRDGYAAERESGRLVVARYRPAGESCGRPYGETRDVIWSTEEP